MILKNKTAVLIIKIIVLLIIFYIAIVFINTKSQKEDDSVNQMTSGGCKISGCSQEVCDEKELYTVCSFKPEYLCYKNARCERQADGQCSWTKTPELNE